MLNNEIELGYQMNTSEEGKLRDWREHVKHYRFAHFPQNTIQDMNYHFTRNLVFLLQAS